MSERPTDLRSELRGLAAEDLAGFGDHPSPEELIAYHRRSLPEPRAEELREHLAVCAECTALLLDFEEHWADGTETPAETAREPWHRRPVSLRALAASLGAVALGLLGWIAFQRPADPGAESVYQPENLDPVTSTMRGGSAERPIQVPETADNVVLNLTADGIAGPQGGVYVADLRFGGEIVGRVENTLDKADQFTLTVPSRMLEPGEWEIVLRGPEGTGTERYSFTIAAAEAPGDER